MHAAIGWIGDGLEPGSGAPPSELPRLIHVCIDTSEHRDVSPSIEALSSAAHHVGLLVPVVGSPKGSLRAMIACQSGRRVKPQTCRSQSEGRGSQSLAVEIVIVGPGDPRDPSTLSRYDASAMGLGPAVAPGEAVAVGIGDATDIEDASGVAQPASRAQSKAIANVFMSQ